MLKTIKLNEAAYLKLMDKKRQMMGEDADCKTPSYSKVIIEGLK